MGVKTSKSSVIFVGLDNSGKTTIINSLKSKGKVRLPSSTNIPDESKNLLEILG